MTLRTDYDVDIEYDREVDAVYIWLRPLSYAYGVDLDDDRRIDYAQNGEPIGVELLNVSNGVRLSNLPNPKTIEQLLTREQIKIIGEL